MTDILMVDEIRKLDRKIRRMRRDTTATLAVACFILGRLLGGWLGLAWSLLALSELFDVGRLRVMTLHHTAGYPLTRFVQPAGIGVTWPPRWRDGAAIRLRNDRVLVIAWARR